MIDSSLIKSAVEALDKSVSWATGLVGLTGQRSITDLNKSAAKNSLTMYGITSSNIDSSMYKPIANTIETKTAFLVNTIIQNIIIEDPVKARDFFTRNFSNYDEDNNTLVSHANTLTSSLRESIGSMFDNMEIGVSITEDTNRSNTESERKAKEAILGRSLKKGAVDIVSNRSEQGRSKEAAFMSNGSTHSFKVQAVSKTAGALEFNVTVFVRVNLMEIETSMLLDAMASTKNRSVFSSYLTYRAGLSSFFKGFIMNLKEIEKQVKRDTSQNLSERVLGSLMRNSGFLVPKAISDIIEFKNYFIVITSDDVDRLSREFGLNLSKPSDLHKVFNNMNILSVMIIDEGKQRVTLFDSDRPSQMQVVSLKDISDNARLGSIFASMQKAA